MSIHVYVNLSIELLFLLLLLQQREIVELRYVCTLPGVGKGGEINGCITNLERLGTHPPVSWKAWIPPL